jgi:hypothetical protein
MIKQAGLRPKHDQLKLFATALGLVVLIFVGTWISAKYFPTRPNQPRGTLVRTSLAEIIWACLVCVFVLYQLMRLTIGDKRTNKVFDWTVRRSVRIFNKLKF